MNEQKAMNAYKALRSMESAAALKKAGFTLSDYREAYECLQDYVRSIDENGANTFIKAVAKWFERQGFEVTYDEAVVGWRIR